MNKKVFILIIMLTTVLLFKVNVQAECTSDELQALKIEANNLQFQYELVENKEVNYSSTKYYYKIKVSNMTKDLAIATTSFYYTYNNVDKNGYLLIDSEYIPGSNGEFYIEASSLTSCNREDLGKKTINLPYYNEYSTRNECVGLENYDICKKNIDTTTITEEQFLKYIDDAKNDIKSKQEEKKKEEEKLLEKEKNNDFINFYNKNKKIINISVVGIILFIILVSIVIIKIKDRKKIKIGDNI